MAKFYNDLTIYQGDDWAALVNVTNSDGTPADLTGYTAQAQFRTGIADQTWLVSAALQCVIVLPNQISLSLTSAQTTLLTEPVYCWDLQVTSPDGIVTTLMAGNVNMLFEVTRTTPVVIYEETGVIYATEQRYLIPVQARVLIGEGQ